MASREEVGSLMVSATLDAKEFQDGVSTLKRQLAVTKSEFKAAAAQIGEFGSETDRLKFRQEELTAELKNHEAIVGTLKGRYDELVAAGKENERETQNLQIKYNNARTAMARVANELKSVNVALEEESLGLKKTGEAATTAGLEQKSFGEHIESTKKGIEATKLAMGGMAAVMAGGMIAEWSEGAEKMATSLQTLQIETGDSSQSLERLAVVASGAGLSTDELSQLVGRLDMRISTSTAGTTGFAKALDTLHVNAKEFAQADLPEQAKLIGESLQKAHMPAKQLSTTLKALGLTTADIGKHGEVDLKKVQKALADTAANSTTLGRVLKQAGINMSEFAGASIEDKLKILGEYMDKTKDKSQATALVMQVFGRQGQQMLPLIQNFSELDEYARKLKMPVMDTKEIQLAAQKTKMLQTAMEMMMDSVMVKLLPIVDKLGKAFYDLTANITHPGQAISDFVKEMGPVPALITGAVTAFAAMKVVTGIKTTLTAFKDSMVAVAKTTRILTVATNEETGAETLKLASWIRSSAAAVANTTATIAMTVAQKAQAFASKAGAIAQAAFNAVMDANPIAMVIIAVAGLATGIYELIKHWKTVRAVLSEGWHWLSGEAMKIWTGISNFFKKWGVDLLAIFVPVIGIPLLIHQHWSQITDIAKKVWNSVTAFFKKWGVDLLAVFVPVIGIPLEIRKHWSQITDIAGHIWDSMRNRVRSIVTGLRNDITGEIHSVEDIIGNVFNRIVNIGKTAFHNFTYNITHPLSTLKNMASQAVHDLESVFQHIHIPLPHFSFTEAHKKLFGISLPIPVPHINWYAHGTQFAPGGLAVVGEQGPELVNLPRGSQVTPNGQTQQLLGGAQTLILQIDGYNFAMATVPYTSEGMGRQRVIKLRSVGK